MCVSAFDAKRPDVGFNSRTATRAGFRAEL